MKSRWAHRYRRCSDCRKLRGVRYGRCYDCWMRIPEVDWAALMPPSPWDSPLLQSELLLDKESKP